MFVIRPTLSLAKRLKVRLGSTNAKSTTRLGDWYAVDVVLNKRQFVLAVSSESRLGVLMEAAPYKDLPDRLPSAICEVLRELGVPTDKIESEANEMREFVLAKTDSRSIVGSMTENCRHIQYMASIGRFNLSDPVSISLWLSNVPSLVMDAVFPREAVFARFRHVSPGPNMKKFNPFKPTLVRLK